MPTEFTKEEQEEILELAPRTTFLIIDCDGEVVMDADTKKFAREVCGEGELPVRYIREDLVMALLKNVAALLPESVRVGFDNTLAQITAEEETEEEEIPLAVPVPDSTTVL